MNDCFPLRFNLHKCGYNFGEKNAVFAGMFSVNEAFIEETLAQYDEINCAAANEIAEKIDSSKLSFLKDKKIMICGDSNTSDRLSWGKIVAKVLPCTVIDCAVSGSRSVQLMTSMDSMLQSYKPDIVVVMIGINDSFFCDKEKKNLCTSHDEFKRNLTLIAQKVTKFGAKLIINSLPPSYCEPINQTHPYWSATEENNEIFNDITKSVAESENCVHFDFRNVFEKEKYDILFQPDGTHLMPLAHALIAEKFVSFLGDNYGNN